MDKFKYWNSGGKQIPVTEMADQHIINAIRQIRRRMNTAFYDTTEKIREANAWISHFKKVLEERRACYKDTSIFFQKWNQTMIKKL